MRMERNGEIPDLGIFALVPVCQHAEVSPTEIARNSVENAAPIDTISSRAISTLFTGPKQNQYQRFANTISMSLGKNKCCYRRSWRVNQAYLMVNVPREAQPALRRRTEFLLRKL
jgi:hypothetical protein